MATNRASPRPYKKMTICNKIVRDLTNLFPQYVLQPCNFQAANQDLVQDGVIFLI
jgi:hypothetical protein